MGDAVVGQHEAVMHHPRMDAAAVDRRRRPGHVRIEARSFRKSPCPIRLNVLRLSAFCRNFAGLTGQVVEERDARA
jgi:hypothetical protein